jgi:hypothetical protein
MSMKRILDLRFTILDLDGRYCDKPKYRNPCFSSNVFPFPLLDFQ